MIGINELRINNIVKCKISNDAAYYRVVAINGFDGIVYLDGARHKEKIPVEKIKPIPLTEEILLKCGFRKSHNGYDNTFHILEEDGFTVKFTIEHWTNAEWKEYRNRFHADKVGKVEFLHQIQNVFFVLYGKELEVKL